MVWSGSRHGVSCAVASPSGSGRDALSFGVGSDAFEAVELSGDQVDVPAPRWHRILAERAVRDHVLLGEGARFGISLAAILRVARYWAVCRAVVVEVEAVHRSVIDRRGLNGDLVIDLRDDVVRDRERDALAGVDHARGCSVAPQMIVTHMRPSTLSNEWFSWKITTTCRIGRSAQNSASLPTRLHRTMATHRNSDPQHPPQSPRRRTRRLPSQYP